MKRYKIRRDFRELNRDYRPGEEHDFQEWNDEQKAEFIPALIANDRIEEIPSPFVPSGSEPAAE